MEFSHYYVNLSSVTEACRKPFLQLAILNPLKRHAFSVFPWSPCILCGPAVPVDLLQEMHPRECCTVYVTMVTDLSWDWREEKKWSGMYSRWTHPRWALMLWHAGALCYCTKGWHTCREDGGETYNISLPAALSPRWAVRHERGLPPFLSLPQYAALQVSVRLESTEASIILKVKSDSRQQKQLSLRAQCGWGGELLLMCEWRQKSEKSCDSWG